MSKKLFFLWLFGALLCFGAAFYALVGVKMQSAWSDIHQERERTAPIVQPSNSQTTVGGGEKVTITDSPVPVNTDVMKPFSLLMMGIDTTDSGDMAGRTDTLIYAAIDPQNKKATLLSIPRDTQVDVPKRGKDKITNAHAYGGDNLTIELVQNFLGLPVDYYAAINFTGFQQLIDVIGGLNVGVEKTLDFNDRITGRDFHLNKGQQKLTGIQALNYARFRYDAEGDFGRERRQQQVIREMVNQTASIRNISKINSVLGVLGKNVKTDLNLTDIVKLTAKMPGISGSDIQSMSMKATTGMQGGVSYVFIAKEETQRVRQELAKILVP